MAHCDVRQGVGEQVMRVINYIAHFALNKAWESRYHTLVQCSLWAHPTMLSMCLRPNPILAQISLTITMYTLNFTSISKALEHRESLLIFTLRGMEYFQSYKSYLTIEDYSKLYVSLSLSLCLGLFVGAF